MTGNVALIAPFPTEDTGDFMEPMAQWEKVFSKRHQAREKALEAESQKNASDFQGKGPLKRERDDDGGIDEEFDIGEPPAKYIAKPNPFKIRSIRLDGSKYKVQQDKEFVKKLLDGGDSIYILGHCEPGSAELSSEGDFTSGVKATVDDVAKLLATTLELSKDFAGKIKVFGCYSGLSKVTGEQSFASRLKTKMHEDGYLNCRFFGYTAMVSAYDEEHKLAFVGDEQTEQLIRVAYQQKYIKRKQALKAYNKFVKRPSEIRVEV